MPRVLPQTVIYDPNLTLTPAGAHLPVTSGMNAIAHCGEALYAQDANPITSLMAEEGIRALALEPAEGGRDRRLTGSARRVPLRRLALRAPCSARSAWRCITSSATRWAAPSTCRTRRRTRSCCRMRSRTTRAAAPEAMAPHRARAGQRPMRRAGIYDLAAALGAPLALEDIGMPADGLDRAAELATTNPYWNPRPLERGAIRQLLQDAWEGKRPT